MVNGASIPSGHVLHVFTRALGLCERKEMRMGVLPLGMGAWGVGPKRQPGASQPTPAGMGNVAEQVPRSHLQTRFPTQCDHLKSRKLVSDLSTAFLRAHVTQACRVSSVSPAEQDSTAPATDLGPGIQAPRCSCVFHACI